MTDFQTSGTGDKSIGDIIAEANNLSASQVSQILAHQQKTGLKFGEAAVALGFIKREDVLWALSQQFHYPYQAEGGTAVCAELVVATKPFDAASEFFRDVRSQLISNLFADQDPRKALAICSPNVGDGKSFFAANLAVAFSQLGGRTLLVDADMRTPRLHEIFGIENPKTGLSGILSGRNETNVIRPIDALPSLFLLPVGVVPPNPLELIQRPVFDLLLNELVSKFDYVLVDTPAFSHGADARVVAAKCGASVALGRKGQTAVPAMKQLVATLGKRGQDFAGVILNEFNA
ncbi:polysaccharide biosynthesis tyrosine autokinase [Aquabacterium sp.]|uniref:polysaccharide biosynthesis tyrosine autokinase n=1 Tax=Aquabacterium sp. TaxID=1872578 RepID=UPI0024895E64|nr:polysaccharide biosynthesis tyrosine autokinase [Aquabacterium sp.]MDI1259300.1 polysaccharide biosynthesis tyrosine autokinase [Aquabacterium sp.]